MKEAILASIEQLRQSNIKSDSFVMFEKGVVIDVRSKMSNYKTYTCTFWLSVQKAKYCLFSRRNGFMGKVVFGYSICLRMFGKTII